MRLMSPGVLIASALAVVACSAPGPETADWGCDLPHVPGAHCSAAHEMLLTDALPISRGNQYADSDSAAQLGFNLFFNTALGDGVGCVTCHAPEYAFTDRVSVSTGKALGSRNAPTVFNVARLHVIFWDGRADSVWSQPLFAIENPLEMASSRLKLAHLVADTAVVRAKYEAAFGSPPDMASWPATGKPGDSAFDGLSPEVQDQVNRVAANVGKSLDAYMRKNTTRQAAFDRFLAGDTLAIIEAAQRGLGVFLNNGCQTCHSGTMLSDERFHKVTFPRLAGAQPDSGSAAGLAVLKANIFNLQGPYADAGPGGIGGPAPAEPGEEGAFRTPPLRNVTRTFPYGHDGAVSTLREVLLAHAPTVAEQDRGDLLAFMETLNGEYPAPPWNDWPSHQ